MKKSLTAFLVPFAAIILFSCFLGCEDDDVGYPCELNATPGATTTTTKTNSTDTSPHLNPQSIQCKSRLCLQPQNTTMAMCTKVCDSDSDCPEATDSCTQGFHCVIGVATGGLRFCTVCVCKGTLVNGNLTTFTTGNENTPLPSDITPSCPKN